jgi:hypothetical protein
MKTLLAAAFAVCLAVQAQNPPSPLRITSFRNELLQWSNQVFAPFPVYQLLAANTVTGTWQQVTTVVGQTSLPLTNSLVGAPGAVFHKLSWNYSNDAHMVFDYAFDEGYGIPAVVGTLDLNSSVFFGPWNIGSWDLDEFVCIDCVHPIGRSNFATGGIDWSVEPHLIVLNFTAGSERVFLAGEMETSFVNGRQVYTGMHGDVYLSGFAGTDLIGTFAAERR